MLKDVQPTVWAVAGCLFEVSLPEGPVPWRWVNPRPEVTLVGERLRPDGRHFRFRAEPASAVMGDVDLRFRGETEVGATLIRVVVVRVAPEED